MKASTRMSGKFLLDTNILIAFFNKEKSVIDYIKSGVEIYIPSAALGEMYFGAEKSAQKKSNIEKIDHLAEYVTIIPCDKITAKVYGKIKNQLKDKGTPIPENDIWIAALSVQHHITLVSRDKHFNVVDKLDLVRW